MREVDKKQIHGIDTMNKEAQAYDLKQRKDSLGYAITRHNKLYG